MIYRKSGFTERWENGARIEVRECGVATEDGERFECRPDPDAPRIRRAPSMPPRIEVPDGVRIERLIVTRGVAEQAYGEKRWSEESERVHVALVRDATRVLVDGVADVALVAEALTRLAPEREAPPRLRLAPNVTAALIPSLLDLAPPNVALIQTAGGIDGKGEPIVEASGDWPNWYRPSYRVRPVRMPLNVRIECAVTEIDRERPRAVALLAPVRGATLRVLVDDGRVAYPAVVRVTRIDAVAEARRWYPYGAGSFGAEMML